MCRYACMHTCVHIFEQIPTQHEYTYIHTYINMYTYIYIQIMRTNHSRTFIHARHQLIVSIRQSSAPCRGCRERRGHDGRCFFCQNCLVVMRNWLLCPDRVQRGGACHVLRGQRGTDEVQAGACVPRMVAKQPDAGYRRQHDYAEATSKQESALSKLHTTLWISVSAALMNRWISGVFFMLWSCSRTLCLRIPVSISLSTATYWLL
jgi:hypothetical protein